MKNPNPLEKDIERRVCQFAKEKKFLCYKFTSPAQSHVPDRIFITPAGVVFMIEFKRKGKKPTPAQEIEIAKIRATGVKVYVIDSIDEGKEIISGRILVEGIREVGSQISKDLDEMRRRKAAHYNLDSY